MNYILDKTDDFSGNHGLSHVNNGGPTRRTHFASTKNSKRAVETIQDKVRYQADQNIYLFMNYTFGLKFQ